MSRNSELEFQARLMIREYGTDPMKLAREIAQAQERLRVEREYFLETLNKLDEAYANRDPISPRLQKRIGVCRRIDELELNKLIHPSFS